MNNPMDFDEAWEHMNKLGFPVIQLTDDQYNQLMNNIDDAIDINEIDELFDDLQ